MIDRYDDGLFAGLSAQEKEVLHLIQEGLSNREIAARMYLAEQTVKNYVSRLLAKLGVASRTEAAVLFARFEMETSKDDDYEL